MKALALLASALVPLLAMQACDDDTTDEPTTDGGASSSSSSSGASGSSSGSSGSSGSSDGGLVKPADCDDLDLTGALPLLSQSKNQFDTAAATPIVRSIPVAYMGAGDKTLSDRLVVYLHGLAGVGTLAIDPDPKKLFIRYTDDGIGDNYMQSCLACSDFYVDRSDDDAGNGTYAKTFSAVAGTIEVQAAITPNQTQGLIHGLEYREMQYDEATAFYTVKPGGQCYWAAEIPFDTREPDGCKPFAGDNACGAGKDCLPVNAIGSDGQCVVTGDKALGETCTGIPAETNWGSDCATGLRCLQDSEAGDTTTICHQVCNELADTNECPEGTLCGGGYNICLPVTELAHSGVDPAKLGEDCTQKSGDDPTSWATYCGGTGKKRGTCVDTDGMAGPLPPKCMALITSVTELPAGMQAGEIGYKGQQDLSTLWPIGVPFIK